MYKNATKCKQNTKQMVHKQAWSIKSYRYVWDVSRLTRTWVVDEEYIHEDEDEGDGGDEYEHESPPPPFA
jgi:hypothetical protein